jgi:hypothetical protein
MKAWGAIIAVAGFLIVLAIIGAPSDAEKRQLRTQFRLSDDVALAEVRVDRSGATLVPPPIEGVARFTEAQFRRYVAGLDDPRVWNPVPIVNGGSEFFGPYAPDTLVWRDLKVARQLGWGSLSWERAQRVRTGRLLCFTVREGGVVGDKAVFRGEPCLPPNSPTANAVHVQGLLDVDAGELHMLIRQTRR